MPKYQSFWSDKEVETRNPNVPEGAEIIGEKIEEDNLIRTFYLIRHDPPVPGVGRWAFFEITSQSGDQPRPTNRASMNFSELTLGDESLLTQV